MGGVVDDLDEAVPVRRRGLDGRVEEREHNRVARRVVEDVEDVAGATLFVAANTGAPCAQYRYSPLGGTTSFTTPTDQIYVNQSLYAIRVGVRFSF